MLLKNSVFLIHYSQKWGKVVLQIATQPSFGGSKTWTCRPHLKLEAKKDIKHNVSGKIFRKLPLILGRKHSVSGKILKNDMFFEGEYR